ncbi:MAG: hypothetical protein LRY27_00690, partial [Chitinophagales bacterium]|nr:hypothetical protein [Chitinophagales bacterium]
QMGFNGLVIPLGSYATNNLYFGMETMGYAKVGYGGNIRYTTHLLKNKRLLLGGEFNYFQNGYNAKKLIFARNNYLGCPDGYIDIAVK